MAIRFRKLVRPSDSSIEIRTIAESHVRGMTGSDTMVFLSHKTGDTKADVLAVYLSTTHQIKIYMAEWDDNIYGDSSKLPEYIIEAIGKSKGFLVNVIREIGTSMWIGYEIGAAHAMKKERAKVLLEQVPNLPSVVNALEALRSKKELDIWVKTKIL